MLGGSSSSSPPAPSPAPSARPRRACRDAVGSAGGGEGAGGLTVMFDPAEALRLRLPKGAQVSGCMVSGLMGVEGGQPVEVDPNSRGRASRAVTLLLGRMPGTSVRAVGDLPGSSLSAVDCMKSWLHPASPHPSGHTPGGHTPRGHTPGSHTPGDHTPGEVALVPHAAWLLISQGPGGVEVLQEEGEAGGGSSLLHWLQGQAGDQGQVVVAGGLASGSGELFLAADPELESAALQSAATGHVAASTPASSRATDGGAAQCSASTHEVTTRPRWAQRVAEASAAMKDGPRFVGLAFCSPPTSHAPDYPPTLLRGVNNVEASAALEPLTSRPQICGVNRSHASTGAEGARASAGCVRAAAMSMRGVGPVKGCSVWRRLKLAREDLEDSDEEGGGQGARATGSKAQVVAILSGESSSFRGEGGMAAELRAALSSRRQALPLYLALWREDAVPQGLPEEGCTHHVLLSGKALVCEMLGRHLMVLVGKEDIGTLDTVMGQGEGRVCAQFMTVTAAGCREHLATEVKSMKEACGALQATPGHHGSGPGWEGYRLLREAALAAGARSAAVGAAVFSCNGRGRSIFGAGSNQSEALILDEVMTRELPFVGAYLAGELGPYIRHGYAGWAFTPAALAALQRTAARELASGHLDPQTSECVRQLQHAGRAGAGPNAGRLRAAEEPAGCSSAPDDRDASPEGRLRKTVVAGRVLTLDDACLQGYTSMYAMLG
ncbi:hypothetical protein V8C86DRAFT_2574598 [Haematococcus lacustris]